MIKDRVEAGQLLAEKISSIKEKDFVVLAIPRGGVIVGHEIAKKLGCRLDIAISKKITPPDNPEFAIGAITHDGTLFRSDYWDNYAEYPNLVQEIEKKKLEVKRRLEEYRGSSEYNIDGKTVILVDDGIATGSTVFAILNWLEKQNVKEIILAIPVMPASIYELMKKKVSLILALESPEDFSAVGQFYKNFDQVPDSEVMKVLEHYKS
ncbi:MAG: phosphoribosyltransferase [Nitrosopumilaceae archaeon]